MLFALLASLYAHSNAGMSLSAWLRLKRKTAVFRVPREEIEAAVETAAEVRREQRTEAAAARKEARAEMQRARDREIAAILAGCGWPHTPQTLNPTLVLSPEFACRCRVHATARSQAYVHWVRPKPHPIL